MLSNSPTLASVEQKSINIVGFDWDKTLLPFMSNGFQFLLGDDNKADHKELRSVLLELIGGEKSELLKSLKANIQEIFIHTQGTEVELVDEQGTPYPEQLFYSGKKAVISYLEALLGDKWREIIPEENIHSLSTEDTNSPITKSRIAFTKQQYDQLKESIHFFRNSMVSKEHNTETGKFEVKLSGTAKYNSGFLKEQSKLVNSILDQPNIVHSQQPLKPHQINLYDKAIHLSEALEVIIEKYKKQGISIQIDNGILVDDEFKNCFNLAGLRQAFASEIRNLMIIKQYTSEEELEEKGAMEAETGWSVTIPLLLSQEEKAKADVNKRLRPQLDIDGEFTNNKLFFTDLQNEVIAGSNHVKHIIKTYIEQDVLEEKLPEISQCIIALTDRIAKTAFHTKKKSGTPHPQVMALHKTFFTLIDSIIKLTTETSNPTILKNAYQIFNHPYVKNTLSLIANDCKPFLHYFFKTLYPVETIDAFYTFIVTDTLKNNLSAPLSTLAFLLKNTPGMKQTTSEINSEAILRLLNVKTDPIATAALVRYFLSADEEFHANRMLTHDIFLFNYMHPMMHAIGIDPENKNRFALCKELIEKGVRLNNSTASLLFKELIDQRDLAALEFFCDFCNDDEIDFNISTPYDPSRRFAETSPFFHIINKLKSGNFHPDDVAIFKCLNRKQKIEGKYLVEATKAGDLRLVELLSENRSEPEKKKTPTRATKVIKPKKETDEGFERYAKLINQAKGIKTEEKQATDYFEIKTEPNPVFDPIVEFVFHLTKKHPIHETQLDEIIHYARWYLFTGGQLEQLIAITDRNENSNNMVSEVRALILDRKPPAPARLFTEIQGEFEGKGSEVTITLASAEIKELGKRVADLDSIRHDITAYSYEELKANLLNVAQACKDEFKVTQHPALQSSHKDRLLALLREVYWRTLGIYPNDVQMFNVLALINDSKRGRLAQIKTGEGKSTIIALLSAYYGLLGLKPDIVTTHEDLAERDAKKLAPFYNTLGLRAAYVKAGKKMDPKAEIYYGTFDAYESHSLDQEMRIGNGRSNRPFDTLIVDEADNLFIDNKDLSLRALFGGENNERLISLYKEVVKEFGKQSPERSHPIKFIRKLAKDSAITLGRMNESEMRLATEEELKNDEIQDEAIFLKKIWFNSTTLEIETFLKSVKDPNRLELYSKIFSGFENQVKFLLSLNPYKELKLDNNQGKEILRDWIDAKYTYKKDRDYEVLQKEIIYAGAPRKVPDKIEFWDNKDTGQLQGRLRYWSMHTFVEIMHDVPPKLQNAIVAKASHISHMQKYKYGSKCLTGTITEKHDCDELKETCGIETYHSPTYLPIARKEEAPIIVDDSTDENAYENKLVEEVIKRRNNQQPVVIFVDNPKACSDLAATLRKRLGTGNDSVQYYNGIQQTLPEKVIKQAAVPGMVTIVTNIGGRGMDIPATNENPLHLIFTDLFSHRRVEAQAIGRTGRQGRKGTYNYVLSASDVCSDLKKLVTPENIEKICKNPNEAIRQYYKKVEEKTLGGYRKNLIELHFEHLSEQIQHFYMSLDKTIREDKLYRWVNYLSQTDEILKKLPSHDSSNQREKEGIKFILSEFIDFWEKAGLEKQELWTKLEKDNKELYQTFLEFNFVKTELTLSDLRAHSLYQPVLSKDKLATDTDVNLEAKKACEVGRMS